MGCDPASMRVCDILCTRIPCRWSRSRYGGSRRVAVGGPAPYLLRGTWDTGSFQGSMMVRSSAAAEDAGLGKLDVRGQQQSTIAEKEGGHEIEEEEDTKKQQQQQQDQPTSSNGSSSTSPAEQNGAGGVKSLRLKRWQEGAMDLKDNFKNNKSVGVVKRCGTLLSDQIWPVLCLTVFNSAARFALCWGLYKTVAAVAIMFFGVPASSIPQQMLPPVGGEGDSAVYTRLADITFLLFKPLDYLVKGVFLAALLLVCTDSSAPLLNKESQSSSEELKLLSPRRIWRDICRTVAKLWVATRKSPNIIIVHIFVGALTAAYQGLCLMIIPFMFASRRLLNIQLSLYLAAIEGQSGRSALIRSKELVEPIRSTLYLPYILLFAAPKLLGAIQDKFFQAVPGRLFAEVPELTWSFVVIVSGSAFLLDRMLEILPVVVYAATTRDKEAKV